MVRVLRESDSKEIDREVFVSLIKLGSNQYSILNDGYFVPMVSARYVTAP